MFREMRRFKQQLSGAECADILTRAPRGVMALSGDGGYPYAVPVNFVYLPEENAVAFHCAREGHKLDAIRRDPRVCLTLWTDGEQREDWSYYVESVVVFGRAECVADEARREAVARRLGNRYFPDPQMTEDDIRGGLSRAEIVVITIDHMTGKLVHEK